MSTRFKKSRLVVWVSSADRLAMLTLALICIAFFWRMAFTDQILPRGDTFAYFYPYWAYRNASLAAGRIPLWNPYLFMGVPFLANSQAGVLYPLNWPLMWLDAPTAIKVATVAHITLAAWGMYALARRSFNRSILASVFAALIFALGGYVSSQVEHINQLQGLAWLPLLVWLCDEVMDGRYRFALPGFSVALAMQLLAGHSQTAFISATAVGLWGVWRAIGGWRDQRHDLPHFGRAFDRYLPLLRPIGLLSLAALAAVGLAAAQIAPTLELTGLSNRSGGLPFLEALSFSLRPYLIGRALLPQYVQPTLFTEYVAYIGVPATVIALLGVWARRKNWKALGLVALAALGFFLALGAYNPIYWLLVRFAPGFGLFRAPARWLALWALAAAGLAGIGLDWIKIEAPRVELKRALATASAVIGLLMLLTLLAPLAGSEVPGASRPQIFEAVIWIGSLLLTLAALLWLRHSQAEGSHYATTSLVALSVVELFIASRVQPFNALTVPAAWSEQRPAISTLLAVDQGAIPPARFLSLSDTRFDPGDLHEIEASYRPYLSDNQIYDYVVATKEKEILAPNLPLYWRIPAMDGFDGGILPLRDYTRFTSFFVDKNALSPDGRLRENLKAVPDLKWLQIANVRWIITDKVYDAWVQGVYFDLQFPEQRQANNETPPSAIEAYPPQAFDATEVGVVGHIEATESPADGAQIGTIAIYPTGADDQTAIILPLLVDTRQPGAIGTLDRQLPVSVGQFTPGRPDITEFRSLVAWHDAQPVEKVKITVVSGFQGSLVVRGLTLIDDRTAAFSAMTLSQGNVLRLANSGDVKVYDYQGALPRAYLVCAPKTFPTSDEAWAAVQNIPASDATVVEDPTPPVANCDASNPGSAEITEYTPEQVSVKVRAGGPGTYLVLSDTWYPGWEARVDGRQVSVLRADGLFRAVRITGRDQEVVFRYRSRPFEMGVVVSGISVVGLLAFLILPVVRQRRR